MTQQAKEPRKDSAKSDPIQTLQAENERLRQEVASAQQSEAAQVAATAELEARLFDLTEQLRDHLARRSAQNQQRPLPDGLAEIMVGLRDHDHAAQAQVVELSQRQDQIEAREDALSGAASHIEQLQANLADAERHSARKDDEVEVASRMILELQHELRALQAEHHTLQQRHDESVAEHTSLRLRLDAVGAENTTLRQATEADQAQRAKDAARLSELDALVADQRTRLETQEDALAQMARKVELAETALAAAQDTAQRRQQEIRHLTQELIARDNRIDELTASTSWRVTAPMRRCRDLLNRFRR